MENIHHHHHMHIRQDQDVHHHHHLMNTTLTEDVFTTVTTTSTTTTSTTTITTTYYNINHHHHYHHHHHHYYHHHDHHHYSPEKSENLIEDRLSSLPDALLTQILSLLSTKDSVRTSVLSKRWKYIFCHVPTLSFCYNDKPLTSLGFVKFVDGVLRVHDVWRIRSFQLFLDSFIDELNVYPWICAAIRRNATRIEVDVMLAFPCPLPLNLFKSQMLVHLELCGRFVFGITDTIELPNLRILRIGWCVFPSGDLAARLFSSCPVLEELTFDSCGTKDIKVMSISVPSLKSLTISCTYGLYSECEWELNVPNLEYITCEGPTVKWYSISILKSLKKSYIRLKDYFVDDGDKLSGLVNKFEEVQFLSLSHDTMEALACVSFSPPMFSKLKTLELNVECCEGWSFFPTLLERAPCLELLVIPEPGFSDSDNDLPDIGSLLPKSVPLCFSRSLKEVQFCWSKGDEVEYEWLGYLLENAEVLDKLIIFVESLKYEAHLSYLERQSAIREVLLALPRASKTCEIVVREK